MLLKLFTLYCLFVSSLAWLAPERCAQSNKQKRSINGGTGRIIRAASNIREVAAKQHEDLLETYQNYRFLGVPVRVTAIKPKRATASDDRFYYPEVIEIHTPYNCTFHTYDPRLLSSVACINAACKLSHTVSTVDTYTASEGYNWGVKISSKFSLFEKLFEIGGEASTGGTYSCTYNKGRTVTDLVECSDSTGTVGQLLLYNVKSDMSCEFGDIKLERDYRDNGNWHNSFNGPAYGFSSAEVRGLKASAQVFLESHNWFMLDTNKVPDGLLRKLLNKVPLFNPYTDLILAESDDTIRVLYFKQFEAVQQYRSIVPFTNEAGDSVYQYACTKL